MVHGSVASTEMKRGRQRDGAIRTDIDARQKRATLKECMLLAVENDTNPKRKRGRNVFPRLRFGLVCSKEPSEPFSAEFWPGVDRQV